jgi:hypothetical protein
MSSTIKQTYPDVIEVYVNEKNIENGECGNPSLCPLSLALYNQLGMNGCVGIKIVYFNDFDKMQTHEYAVDEASQKWIMAFDRGQKVVPFTCTLKKVRVL